MITSKLNKYALLIKIEPIFTSNIRYKANFKVIPENPTKTAVNLSYKIYGEPATYPEEPTILLVHGFLGSKKHWDSIGKTMVNVMKKAVVSIDLRNHGDSPHVNSHKYEDLVADILKLLDKLSIKRASLVGHSMGGKAVMGVSLTAPNKIAGLLVVDISPISAARHLTDFLPEVLVAMKEIDFTKSKKISDAKTEATKQLKKCIKDDLLLKAILSNIKIKSDHKVGWACNIDVLIKHFKYIASFPEILRKKTFYGPTLFIGGQLSEYLPPDDLSGIREMFPRAVVSFIPQVGHHLHVEDPKTFLEIAMAFPDLASDVSSLITRLSIEQAAIIGHSMGGRTGMVLALSEPSKISKLLVVDISPVSTARILNNFFPKLIDAMKTVDFRNITNVVNARSVAKEKLVASGIMDADSTGFILMNIGVKQDKSIGWLCNIDVLKQHFTDIASFPNEMTEKQYMGPTLFIGGDQSNYIPPSDLTGIKKIFPNANLKYVKGVGHNVHAESPVEFLRLVKEFLTT
nr:protein ABHD11-like [Maniola hyperantus]